MNGLHWRSGSEDDSGSGPPPPAGRRMVAFRESGFGFGFGSGSSSSGGGGQEGRGRSRGPGPDFGKEFAKEFSFRFEQEFRDAWGGGRQRTRFERGDIRLVILTLLAERPMHGYEIIKEMERRFGGAYAPSPGSIYPTLQMLEDMGLVSAQHAEGKKVYTITDDGLAHLKERQENVENLWGRVGGWWRSQEAEQVRLLMHEFRALMTALRPALQRLSPEQVQRLRTILERTRREIDEVFSGVPASAQSAPPQPPRPPEPPEAPEASEPPEPPTSAAQEDDGTQRRRTMWGFGPRTF